MFKRLDQVMPDRVNRLKVRKPADTDAVCSAVDHGLDSLWNHAVPMRAISFRTGRVTVAVISAAWGQEIAAKEDRIIDLANRKLRRKAVKEVRSLVAPDKAARSEG